MNIILSLQWYFQLYTNFFAFFKLHICSLTQLLIQWFYVYWIKVVITLSLEIGQNPNFITRVTAEYSLFYTYTYVCRKLILVVFYTFPQEYKLVIYNLGYRSLELEQVYWWQNKPLVKSLCSCKQKQNTCGYTGSDTLKIGLYKFFDKT